MIALPGVAFHCKIYESLASLVYRATRIPDELTLVVKILKQDYPSPQELTRYRQEYEITRSLNLEGVIKAYSQQNYERTLVIILEDFGGESQERWMHKGSENLFAKNAEARYQSAWGIKADLEICVYQLEEIGKIDSIQLGLQDVSA